MTDARKAASRDLPERVRGIAESIVDTSTDEGKVLLRAADEIEWGYRQAEFATEVATKADAYAGLLHRISQWDALNGTEAPWGDGPYWKREIARVLDGR